MKVTYCSPDVRTDTSAGPTYSLTPLSTHTTSLYLLEHARGITENAKIIWNSCVSCHSLPLIVPWSPWSGVNISQNYMNNFLSELTLLFVTWIPVVFSLLCAFLRGWTYKVPFLFDLLHGASVRYLVFPLTRAFLHNLPIVYISLLRSLWLITLCIRCFSTIKIRRSHFQPYTFLQSELPPYVFSSSEFHISLCFTWRYTLSLLSLTHTWLSTTHTFELL